MINKLHPKGIQEQLEKLKREEKRELASLKNFKLAERYKKTIIIKLKYYKLRTELLNNYYSQNQIKTEI